MAIAKEKSWLEEIKDAKGNTEANSLKQAAQINEFGVYDFGLDDKLSKETLNLSDVIRLRLPSREAQVKAKEYSFAKLSDLNDRLTLVVGRNPKHQELITYFDEVKSFFNIPTWHKQKIHCLIQYIKDNTEFFLI